MKIWRNIIILTVGIILVLASLIIYSIQVSRSIVLASTIPPAVQFRTFLMLFLSGLTVLIIYGMMGVPRPDPFHTILVKVFLILIILGNVVTALNYLLLSIPYSQLFSIDFYLKLVFVILALAIILFSLVIWNGFKWGFWGLVVASFFVFILNIIGGVPIIPSIFGASEPVILYFLIRPAWSDLD